MLKITARLNLILLITLVVTACTLPNPSHETAHSSMPMATPGPGTATNMDDMKMKDGNQPFDERFIDSMIMHHQGAIAMAQTAQAEAEHPELKTMADAIITAQAAEIKQMQAWRTAWFPNAPASQGLEMGMGAMQIAEEPSKPFDLRFIEAMIPHHQSAIDMANLALTKTEHAEIKTLAANIIQAQTAEIAQMQTWKAAWFKLSK